jgi:hypothetical protein
MKSFWRHAAEPKRNAAVQFACKVIETRGKVSDADLNAVRDARLHGCERDGDRRSLRADGALFFFTPAPPAPRSPCCSAQRPLKK